MIRGTFGEAIPGGLEGQEKGQSLILNFQNLELGYKW